MLNLLKALRQDEYGVILSTEIVMVGTVLVIGVMTGLACLQKSVNGELGDFAAAIDSIDQSYSFSSHRMACLNRHSGGCCAYTAGSSYNNIECNANDCRHEIVGCPGEILLNCGQCGHCGQPGSACGSCGGQIGHGSAACGTCGGHGLNGGVCGLCGTAGYGYSGSNRPNCVPSGVKNFRVSEYPGTDNVPRTTNEGKSAIRFPGLESCPPGQAPIQEHVVPERNQPLDDIHPIPQQQPLPVHPE